MKSIIVAVLFLFAGLGYVNAQTKPDKMTPKTGVKKMDKPTTAVNKKMDKPTTTTTTTDKTTKVTDKTKTTGMKKDGTPDMRLKENKDAKKPVAAGPLKKDGSADMRYKANKAPDKKK